MVTEKKYFKPETAEEALQLAAENENNFRFVAGGTDILVNKFQGNDDTACLIDITGIEELRQVKRTGNILCIGALITLDELKNYPEIKKHFPVLIAAANLVGSPMIRKTATLGGNLLCENRCSFYNQSEWWREAVGYCLKCDGDICIATQGKKNCFSKFVSDTAVALISLHAYIEILEKKGNDLCRIENLYTGDGVNPRHFKKTSLIKSINIPVDEDFRVVFKKLRQRESLEFSSLSTAVSINKKGKIVIVLGGVDPKPVVISATANDNKEELIKKAVKQARIVDNDTYSREYRKEMIGVYLKRSFEELGL